MKFNDRQFNLMLFRIHKVEDPQKQEMVKRVPAFKRLGKDNKSLRVKCIKYFCYLYDRYSPLQTQVHVLKERKQVAATLAGFNLEEDKHVLALLFRLSNPTYVDVVKQMLKLQHSRAFSMIVAQEAYFEQILEQLVTPVEDEEGKDLLQAYSIKSKLSDNLESIKNQLDTLYEEVYGDNEDVQEIMNADSLLATPEAYASKLTQ